MLKRDFLRKEAKIGTDQVEARCGAVGGGALGLEPLPERLEAFVRATSVLPATHPTAAFSHSMVAPINCLEKLKISSVS